MQLFDARLPPAFSNDSAITAKSIRNWNDRRRFRFVPSIALWPPLASPRQRKVAIIPLYSGVALADGRCLVERNTRVGFFLGLYTF